jgi:hypothetical protein
MFVGKLAQSNISRPVTSTIFYLDRTSCSKQHITWCMGFMAFAIMLVSYREFIRKPPMCSVQLYE